MKWSAIRTWALALIAAAGLLGTTGAQAEKTVDGLRDDQRRPSSSGSQPAALHDAGFARVAPVAAPTVRRETSAAQSETAFSATARRYIPLVVPLGAVLVLVCVAAIWGLAL